jgi:regulatory protein
MSLLLDYSMNEDLAFKELYKKALRFLGIRLRSEKEMRDKIHEWLKKDTWAYADSTLVSAESDSEIQQESPVERVISQLKKDKFINDEYFARQWIESRVRSKPRGESILRMELVQKGIGRDIIDAVLEQVLRSTDVSSETNTIHAMAYKTAVKYARKIRESDHRAYVFKLKQALTRKGFDMSTINRVVDEVLSEGYNNVD